MEIGTWLGIRVLTGSGGCDFCLGRLHRGMGLHELPFNLCQLRTCSLLYLLRLHHLLRSLRCHRRLNRCRDNRLDLGRVRLLRHMDDLHLLRAVQLRELQCLKLLLHTLVLQRCSLQNTHLFFQPSNLSAQLGLLHCRIHHF